MSYAQFSPLIPTFIHHSLIINHFTPLVNHYASMIFPLFKTKKQGLTLLCVLFVDNLSLCLNFRLAVEGQNIRLLAVKRHNRLKKFWREKIYFSR
ncbi:MAG: hypothetical protein Athens101410_296 [Parcubacteria group bacterium Athens1014_10]|nr:MAG: hypothetical protein Athens101410_296 [Parcubacteria group bacterium Athens1014_10]TSD05986.1 MAG: hypothetical protein Athens071412_133 [Parcubacteria group bacterium Athens0714_12]